MCINVVDTYLRQNEERKVGNTEKPKERDNLIDPGSHITTYLHH